MRGVPYCKWLETSQFGVKEHANSHYPLEGKHASVACEKCHAPAGKDTLYKVKFARNAWIATKTPTTGSSPRRLT